MCLSVLGVGSKNSPKTRKNTPKWVKISIFLPKSPQNPPENGFGGGSGQFSALISGKTSKIVVRFRGGGFYASTHIRKHKSACHTQDVCIINDPRSSG